MRQKPSYPWDGGHFVPPTWKVLKNKTQGNTKHQTHLPIRQVYEPSTKRKKSEYKSENHPKNLLAGQYPITGPEKRQLMYQKAEQHPDANVKQGKRGPA